VAKYIHSLFCCWSGGSRVRLFHCVSRRFPNRILILAALTILICARAPLANTHTRKESKCELRNYFPPARERARELVLTEWAANSSVDFPTLIGKMLLFHFLRAWARVNYCLSVLEWFFTCGPNSIKTQFNRFSRIGRAWLMARATQAQQRNCREKSSLSVCKFSFG